MARLLQVNNPLEIDKSLVTSVESILGYKITEQTRTRFTDYGADIELTNIEVRADSIEQVEKAIRAVLASMAPLPVRAIEDQLALLATLVVKPAGETAEDHSLRMASLALQLADFPADIVNIAIDRVKKSARFWPSFVEFYEHIGWRVRKRQLLFNALQKKHVDLTA